MIRSPIHGDFCKRKGSKKMKTEVYAYENTSLFRGCEKFQVLRTFFCNTLKSLYVIFILREGWQIHYKDK